jgi:eukaryotic-like serine/threonine-protein kinase
MDTALSPPVGLLLTGRYHVGSPIARGGMATVYLGTDTRLDRAIAIKIAHPELSDDTEFVRRFIGEARSAARLSSPNVVGIYDQGSDGRLHYIAMEYVPGRTLRDLLSQRRRLGARESLGIMTGVLSGLAAAHQAGLAHRDVKPENVLLTTSGGVKVADFGLARSVVGAAHTKGGMIIGTAAYLAPEQVTGGTSDARTDVYAAGIMLYEMLTGAQPHTGPTPLDVAYKHVNEVVPAPSSLMPGLSPALDALVAMATSRDPQLRPADAGQFLRAIEAVMDGRPLPVEQPSWPHADRRWEPASGMPVTGASALPSLVPQQSDPHLLPAPPAVASWGADPPASSAELVNHTLIVPAGDDMPAGLAGGGHYFDRAGQRHGHRSQRARREPWLQGLLFSRRFVYLSGAVAVVVVSALVGWWLLSGQYSTIPPLRGVAASTAKTELSNVGLHGRIGGRQHSTLAKGDVIATRPAIGSRVTTGSVVTIIVSLGPVMIQVPNVTGQPLQQAQTALRAAHLTPGVVTKAVSSTVPVGNVITTTPHAYASWPQSKPVGLTVSEGPGLPNFVGQQVSAAQAAASAGGYTLNPVADPKGSQPANTITSQSPPANTPITPGEVVTVHYSPGPPPVQVPDVQGMSLHDAIKTLQRAGFTWTIHQEGPGSRVGSYSPSGPQPKGAVITLNVGFFSGL